MLIFPYLSYNKELKNKPPKSIKLCSLILIIFAELDCE